MAKDINSDDKNYFDPVSPKVDFPKLEKNILKYWKKNKIFEKSLDLRKKFKNWTFLDGPPFITGLPHYGSLLSSIAKDIFPRYQTMKGYYVRRVWGWDCHGLPAENKVEEKLGLKDKSEIEKKVGVKKFIEECKSYVSETSSDWEWYVNHVGRWVDFKNAYKTMDKDYMESVMWVFKEMYDKGYIYKGLRVSLYCPHCQTPISNFEVSMDAGENYKEVSDYATTYKYELQDEKGTYLLAWSTTPWNKLATPALAINPELIYVKVKQKDEKYILAEKTLDILNKKHKYKIISKFEGKELIGKKFVPHYDFYEIEKGKRAFVVIGGDFVTADEGTGIVTLAVYGEDDLEVMQKENIQLVMHVKDDGHLKDNVPNWAGKYYLGVSSKVDKDLMERGLVYKKEPHTHTVAHCWRCSTKLFHNPQNAWFVNVQKLKPIMKKTNKTINWYPKHFKAGRFLKSMEAAPDWCISRTRYWGSPIPVWECECGERYVPGSINELEKASGQKIKDLHKPEIDNVTVKCKSCSSQATRVPEVLDSWIEAGSASFAERHYPFNKDIKLKEFFPPDFVSEYTGQIRAWFYVIHVISAALYRSEGFKNVLVTGVILGSDGRKMSKNYGNYPDPEQMIKTYGADALRVYLLGSPVMKGEDILISEEDYKNKVRGFLLPFWNVYNFFVRYARLNGWKPVNKKKITSKHPLDKWILSRMNKKIINIVNKGYEKYDTQEIVNVSWDFIYNELSSWYVRRSRERFLPVNDKKDRDLALHTLWNVLVEFTKVIAPLVPFTADAIYRNLTKKESVHLVDFPDAKKDLIGKTLEKEMEDIRNSSEQIHALRKEHNLPVKRPLVSADVVSKKPSIGGLDKILEEEINAKNINWNSQEFSIDKTETEEIIEETRTRKLIRKIQKNRKELGMTLGMKAKVTSRWLPKNKKLINDIEKKTSSKLIKGKKFKLVKAS